MTPYADAFDEGDITPQSLSEREAELFADAYLGQEAVRFLESDLGRLLRSYANEQIREAQERLLAVSPVDEQAVRNLQSQAAIASQFLHFIRRALDTGESAHKTLKLMKGEIHE